MKILLLTQFFPPETGAAQNRLGSLVREAVKSGHTVTVLTALPNYPEGRIRPEYKRRLMVRGDWEGARVIRIWLWTHGGKSVFSRLLTFISFAANALIIGALFAPRANLLLWESPPLTLGPTAWLLARLKGARLVTNISDLWTESLLSLGVIRPGLLSRLFAWTERCLYKRSVFVSGQTQGIVDSITRLDRGRSSVLWRNGADPRPMVARGEGSNHLRESWGVPADGFVVGFAGLIGRSQGIGQLISAMQRLQSEPFWLVLAGDGTERAGLIRRSQVLGLSNVVWQPPLPHEQMSDLWGSFDCAAICLRRSPVFRGAVPSKMYEAMASGIPIVLAIEGEAAAILTETGCGIAVPPEEPEAFATALRRLRNLPDERGRMGQNGARVAREKYDRVTLTREYLRRLEESAS